MIKQNDSFIQKCLRGEASVNDIDDYIDEWHLSTENINLHAFLGMTDSEYNLWLHDPIMIHYIIAARNENIEY